MKISMTIGFVVTLTQLSPSSAMAAPPVTITDYQAYSSGSYLAYISPFNKGNYALGTNYTEKMTINISDFPNSVAINSNWPNIPCVSGIFNFAAIDFGDYYGTVVKTPIPAKQVKSVSMLTETHTLALSGSTQGFDVIDDMFLTSSAGSMSKHLYEIEVLLHTPSYSSYFMASLKPIGLYTDGSMQWRVAVSNGNVPDIVFMPSTGADVLTSSVSIKPMFDYLISKKVISGNEYFNGMALGLESRQSSGAVAVIKFGVSYR